MKSRRNQLIILVMCAVALISFAVHAAQVGKPAAKAENKSNRSAKEKNSAMLKLYEARQYKTMPYRLLRPIHVDTSKKYPLILSLHGRGGLGNDNIKNLRIWNQFMTEDDLRRKHPCFVVVPQAKTMWRNPQEKEPTITEDNIGDYPKEWDKFLRRRINRKDNRGPAQGELLLAFELVEQISKEFNIDKNRIYVLGHSMGGFGTWNAIWQKPELFAAAIPTAAGLLPWKDKERFADVPVWAFHGAADKTVPAEFTREIFTAMKKYRGNMKYTELKNIGHKCKIHAFKYKGDDKAGGFVTICSSEKCDRTEDIWDWLFNQNLTKRKKPAPKSLSKN